MDKSIDNQNTAHLSHIPHHLKSSSSANSDKNSEREKAMVLGTFLGIDYGQAKIGLALADEETRMAFAFDVLKNDREFLKKLREIIVNENVKKIVIGLTKHERDTKSVAEKKEFAQKIEKEFSLEVFFQEEMFTTKIAQENLKMRGGRNVAKFDDQEAARIILQAWLDDVTHF